MTTWTCIIPDYWPPTPNVRMHWRTRHAATKIAADAVQAYGHPLPSFAGPVELTITREWGHRQRALDPDNLMGSVKLLIDVLRQPRKANEQKNRLGVIEDDRPESFVGGRPVIEQRRADGREKRTVIVVRGTEAT